PGGRRGRCTGCGAVVLPALYSLEWPTAAMFGLLYWRFDLSPVLLVYSVYAVLLLVVLAIDLHHRWVYSVICYPAILAALVLTPVVTDNILDGVLGALLGAGIFLGLYWLRSEEQRLNSSHVAISYAVFCLKKKNVQYTQFVVSGVDH